MERDPYGGAGDVGDHPEAYTRFVAISVPEEHVWPIL